MSQVKALTNQTMAEYTLFAIKLRDDGWVEPFCIRSHCFWRPGVKINEPPNQSRGRALSVWHDWYKGFKDPQTTVWSVISKARASLKASSIRPETQQRAAEQILQSTRCKNGSLKCQSLIHSIWTAPRASCWSAMPQRFGGEKGIFSIGQDHPSLQDELGTTIRKTKQPLHDPVYLHSLSGNCPDPFYELSFKKIMSWFTWLVSSLKLERVKLVPD